jgi:small subunit ribosomal protein S9
MDKPTDQNSSGTRPRTARKPEGTFRNSSSADAAARGDKFTKSVEEVKPGKVGSAIGLGKRKTSVARVRIKPGKGNFSINRRTLTDFFPNQVHQQIIKMPLRAVNNEKDFDVWVNVSGGGVSGQAGAVKHGISRALNQVDQEHNRPILKRLGFLTRDDRKVERKKAGLHKARKAPQYSKR